MADWYDVLGWVASKANKYKDLIKIGVGASKAWLDYKDAKRKGELQEQAYDDYMREAAAAGEEAQAAVDLGLTPMTVTNVPETKADVSSFTKLAARGGLMNLPTRQRKRYAYGPDEFEVETMDEEVISPYDLRMEEGVNIGEQVFHDTGDPMTNAQQVWESGQIDQELYQMDFNLFFESGDWQDHISRGEVQEDTMMASAPGIESLRYGGRPGYQFGIGPQQGIMPQQGLMPQGLMPQQGLMQAAKGGRIRKAPGGIMNLGGLEKDYRTTGGFVPIGAYEKKDDVPARLSKNEFVMTADAVRAAGGGSINKGAQRMYDTMKHLEAQPQAKRMTA